MSTPAGGFNRPKIGDMLKSAFAPRQPIEVDKDAPNPIPRGVRVGGVLLVLSGAVNLITGSYVALARESLINQANEQNNLYVDACAQTPPTLGQLVDLGGQDPVAVCANQVKPYTADQISGLMSQALLIGFILAAVGVITIAAGIGVFRGAVWARRVATVVALLLVVVTFMNLLPSLFQFVATLFTVVALTMLYVGKGANYFIRAKAKGVR